jgi:enamine deaminase RidA (YjgF/YER057c/UK114 family)
VTDSIQRRSINVEGYAHMNPIPAASRVGNLLMSGVVTGRDASGGTPASVEEQCANMFGTVVRIVEAAGGTSANIIKMTIWLSDPGNREALNKEWVKTFPDGASRPARHTFPLAGGGTTLVQCDVTAVF